MVVRALPRPHVHAPQDAATLPALVLGLALAPAALDLLSLVQHSLNLALVGEVTCGFATAGLLLMWLRFPRTSWLAGAAFTAAASLVMRLLGADVAPVLSLLSIVALGIGGAFATTEAMADGLALKRPRRDSNPRPSA